MQRYRADVAASQLNGGKAWFAQWMGGLFLSRINNCLLHLSGDPRATVYTTGEPDTFFSQPAVCWYKGVRLRGYVTSDDDGLYFRPVYH